MSAILRALFVLAPLAVSQAQDVPDVFPPSSFDRVVELELTKDGAILEGHGAARWIDYVAKFAGGLHVWAEGDLDLMVRVDNDSGRRLAEDEDSGGGPVPYLRIEVARGDRLRVAAAAQLPGATGHARLHLVAAPETEATRAAADRAEKKLATADRLVEDGRVDRARTLVAEILADLRATEGARWSDAVAAKLWDAGYSGNRSGKLSATRVAWGAARAHRERTLPPDHPQLQTARANLAVTLKGDHDSEAARALQEKVLEVRARTLAPDHADRLRARLNLAATLGDLGEYGAARAHLEAVLEAYSRTLPAHHRSLLVAQHNLATTLRILGDHPAARALQERVLEGFSRTLPEDHAYVQTARQALATTLQRMGELDAARSLAELVLDARLRTLPEGHPRQQSARMNLAATLNRLGDLEGARQLQQRVLEIRAQALPEAHPLLQQTRQNLAATLAALDRLSAARELQERVLEALSRTLPEDDAHLQSARGNLAMTLLTQATRVAERRADDTAEAFRSVVRAYVGSLRRSAAAAIAESSSREAEERIASRSEQLGYALSWTLATQDVIPLDAGLRSEAFLASEMMRSAALASARLARRAHSDPAWEPLRAKADAASRQLVSAVRAGRSVAELDALRAACDLAQRELVRLADRLLGDGVSWLEPDLAALTARLGPADAMVAWRRYTRWMPEEDGQTWRATASLGAFVLRPGVQGAAPDEPTLEFVELGPVEPIEAAVRRWRSVLGTQSGRGLRVSAERGRDEDPSGELLRALILDPLRTALEGVDRAIVVLDDVLHLVPLDALSAGEVWARQDRRAGNAGAAGSPEGLLGDSLHIEVRASLLELLAVDERPLESRSLVVLGGADFSARPQDRPAGGTGAAGASRGILRGGPWEAGFSPLPGTLAEVRAMRQLFVDTHGRAAPVSVLAGAAASRANLIAQAPRSRWLHIASHGWFAPESVRSRADSSSRDVPKSLPALMSSEERVRAMSPMLLCGLALAGANLPADEVGRIPGLVTAQELSTLNLTSCELAVLSACDTNVGERRAGQGVASLQRALHMAGARSVITSLWQVPDESTKELMVDFYRRVWVEKQSKHRALWEAKMRIRNMVDAQGKRLYGMRDWAGWVLTGEPEW